MSGDGRPDLVVSVYSNRLAVLLGDGAGGFAAPVNYAVGLQPYHVAIADLNQDRVPDLVSANSGANTISVLLGSGGGAFAAPTNFAVGPGPLGVGVGDLNRDGKPDLAVVAIGTTSTMPSQIGVLLGNGAGGFSDLTSTSPAAHGRSRWVISTETGASMRRRPTSAAGAWPVVFGNGTGGFGAATDYPTTGFMGDVALADLNSDGHLDLIGAASSGAQLYVLRNNGAGVFGPVMTVPASANASSVIAGDVDRDGFVDLIAGDASGNSIAVMRGIGGGAFAAAVTFPVGTAPRHLALTDLNADGTVDVLVANNLGGSVTRLLGNLWRAEGSRPTAPAPPASLACWG